MDTDDLFYDKKFWKEVVEYVEKEFKQKYTDDSTYNWECHLGGYTVGHAEEQQAFFLDEMVVTATRTPVEAFKANANISVITKKEIEERHYQDLSCLLYTSDAADE